MSENSPDMTFDEWARAVDALCRRHFCCSWADLCDELEPMQRAYVSAETPMQFVEWIGQKYDLTWANSIPGLRASRA